MGKGSLKFDCSVNKFKVSATGYASDFYIEDASGGGAIKTVVADGSDLSTYFTAGSYDLYIGDGISCTYDGTTAPTQNVSLSGYDPANSDITLTAALTAIEIRNLTINVTDTADVRSKGAVPLVSNQVIENCEFKYTAAPGAATYFTKMYPTSTAISNIKWRDIKFHTNGTSTNNRMLYVLPATADGLTNATFENITVIPSAAISYSSINIFLFVGGSYVCDNITINNLTIDTSTYAVTGTDLLRFNGCDDINISGLSNISTNLYVSNSTVSEIVGGDRIRLNLNSGESHNVLRNIVVDCPLYLVGEDCSLENIDTATTGSGSNYAGLNLKNSKITNCQLWSTTLSSMEDCSFDRCTFQTFNTASPQPKNVVYTGCTFDLATRALPAMYLYTNYSSFKACYQKSASGDNDLRITGDNLDINGFTFLDQYGRLTIDASSSPLQLKNLGRNTATIDATAQLRIANCTAGSRIENIPEIFSAWGTGTATASTNNSIGPYNASDISIVNCEIPFTYTGGATAYKLNISNSTFKDVTFVCTAAAATLTYFQLPTNYDGNNFKNVSFTYANGDATHKLIASNYDDNSVWTDITYNANTQLKVIGSSLSTYNILSAEKVSIQPITGSEVAGSNFTNVTVSGDLELLTNGNTLNIVACRFTNMSVGNLKLTADADTGSYIQENTFTSVVSGGSTTFTSYSATNCLKHNRFIDCLLFDLTDDKDCVGNDFLNCTLDHSSGNVMLGNYTAMRGCKIKNDIDFGSTGNNYCNFSDIEHNYIYGAVNVYGSQDFAFKNNFVDGNWIGDSSGDGQVEDNKISGSVTSGAYTVLGTSSLSTMTY